VIVIVFYLPFKSQMTALYTLPLYRALIKSPHRYSPASFRGTRMQHVSITVNSRSSHCISAYLFLISLSMIKRVQKLLRFKNDSHHVLQKCDRAGYRNNRPQINQSASAYFAAADADL